MKLELRRTHLTDRWTLGELWIDDVFAYFTCEDCARPTGIKIPGETAIPYGTYEIKLEWSKRYRQIMPYVQGVPMFDRIICGHPGNSNKDTRGCVLIGDRLDLARGRVLDSVKAFNKYYPKIKRACSRGRVTLTIVDTHIVSDMRTSLEVH